MATAIIMPRQGQSVESCIITAWKKNVGDSVNVGDVLFSYETDKAAFDEEAKVAGTLLARFFEEGDDVPCLTNVCVSATLVKAMPNSRPMGKMPKPPPAPSEAQSAAPAAEAIEATGRWARE